MRVCVFSDIHGNGPAFARALPLILAEHADWNVFLGDLCGYYFDEMEIWRSLCEIPRLISLLGNHDRMFLEAAHGRDEMRQDYRSQYGPSLDEFLSKDNAELVKWLSERPTSHVLPGESVAMYHASPWDPLEEYVYPDSSLDRFSNLPQQWFLLGHTHHPMHRCHCGKVIVNPGSIGQPRNGGRPGFAVVDLSIGSVVFREFSYDVADTLEQAESRSGIPPYLKNVLVRRSESHV